MKYLFAFMILGCVNLLAVEFRAVNAIGGVNLRKEPRKNAPLVTTIPDAAIVKILDQKEQAAETIDGFAGKWLNAEIEGKSGWVFSRFLTEFPVTEDCLKFFGRVEGQAHPGQKLICGRGRDRLLLNAQWFGRRMLEENMKWNPEGSRTQLRQLNKIIQIHEIEGNLAIVTVPAIVDDVFTFISPKSLWIFKGNFWQPMHIGKRRSVATIVKVNNDEYADAIESSGCCGWVRVTIYFGQSDGNLKQVFEKAFVDNNEFKLMSKTCQNLLISGAEIDANNPNENPRRTYTFDCRDGRFANMPLRK
ncbi:SH3 domain-containing protein [Turneriella parva]|uniref:SH3b domain-containing protein n=1 Tax=Turneriella parva (strain ATCC BAA-1111 / DSM 21527 / NCTC 11395 / H) TaxID=869212 RepID=I4BA29_TURPD|nr:SH3 domain-containing protein [Turneriella parva]AFM14136.1 hypothetical protein Turpa_3499 [Turneriella parva DSM 21527]